MFKTKDENSYILDHSQMSGIQPFMSAESIDLEEQPVSKITFHINKV